MSKTQSFIGALALTAIGTALAVVGACIHHEAMFTTGVGLLGASAGWFGFPRPQDIQ